MDRWNSVDLLAGPPSGSSEPAAAAAALDASGGLFLPGAEPGGAAFLGDDVSSLVAVGMQEVSLDGDSGGEAEGAAAPPLPPLCLKVRQPPLWPKRAAPLERLEGIGGGSLLGAPTIGGGLRLWAGADGPLGSDDTQGGGRMEDWSDATYSDVGALPGVSVSCVLALPSAQAGVQDDSVGGGPDSLWTGHSNGVVVRWQTDPLGRMGSWGAHRNGGVAALCLTSSGDIWSGSTRGSLRRFQGAALHAPRSGADSTELRRANGERAHGTIRSLLCCPMRVGSGPDGVGEVVWSIGTHTALVWCARTGAHLASVGAAAEAELSMLHEVAVRWEGAHAAAAPGGGAAEAGGPGLGLPGDQLDRRPSFDDSLGGSGFAPEGAAAVTGEALSTGQRAASAMARFGKQAVRKIGKVVQNTHQAVRDEEGEAMHPHGRLLASCAGEDGLVWLGYESGRLERREPCGPLVEEPAQGQGILICGAPVTALLPAAGAVWVGLGTGEIMCFSAPGARPLLSWRAHRAPIRSLAKVGPRVFSLCTEGAIHGWDACAPLDEERRDDLRRMVSRASRSFLQPRGVKLLAGTWNVNNMKAPDLNPRSVAEWLGAPARRHGAQLCCVGLQEVEVGGRSVAEGIVKDAFGAVESQERGNSAAQGWAGLVEDALNDSCGPGGLGWVRVGLRQMAGMVMVVFVRKDLEDKVGEVATDSVACGLMGVGGNKGAVAVGLTVFRRRMLFLGSHFAAHQGAVHKRNADYESIIAELAPGGKPLEGGGSRSRRGSAASASGDREAPRAGVGGILAAESPWVRSSEGIVWVGDFNYRVDGFSRDEAVEKADRGRPEDLEELVAGDQCRREMAAGHTFRGFREAPLTFRPTFKFDKRSSTYDTSEKQRIPAWCDRIFFRGSRVDADPGSYGLDLTREWPGEGVPREGRGRSVAVNGCKEYGSCHGVIDSDHKPVFAVLDLALAEVDNRSLLRVTSKVLTNLEAPSTAADGLAVSVEPAQVALDRTAASPAASAVTLTIRNDGLGSASFLLGKATGSRGGKSLAPLPPWLSAEPARGTISPGGQLGVRLALHETAVGSDPLATFPMGVLFCPTQVEGGAAASELSRRTVISVVVL